MTEHIDLDEMEREHAKIDARLRKIEEEGFKNILKHFDRIHDKLFIFNNILIAGFFALPKFDKSAPEWSIVIPISNMIFLIYVEFRMMEQSRFDSDIRNKPYDKILAHGKTVMKTNSYSLLIILTTFVVTTVFLWFLL
jgi:hypothetical protein